MEKQYITSAEAARLLGVGPTSIKRWADSGLLPCVKTPGRHRRFLRDDIERLMREEGRKWMPDEQQLGAWIQLLLNAVGPFEVQVGMLSERARWGAWWMVCDALAPVLEELRARREAGRIQAAQQQEALNRLCRAFERCAENVAALEQAPTCLLAAARGGHDTAGLSALEVCLRDAGWSTRWDGAATPAPELLELLAQGSVDMLALPASRAGAERAAGEHPRVLVQALPQHDLALVPGPELSWPDPDGSQQGSDGRLWIVPSHEELHRLLAEQLSSVR